MSFADRGTWKPGELVKVGSKDDPLPPRGSHVVSPPKPPEKTK